MIFVEDLLLLLVLSKRSSESEDSFDSFVLSTVALVTPLPSRRFSSSCEKVITVERERKFTTAHSLY
jgi:hypothetical protein